MWWSTFQTSNPIEYATNNKHITLNGKLLSFQLSMSLYQFWKWNWRIKKKLFLKFETMWVNWSFFSSYVWHCITDRKLKYDIEIQRCRKIDFLKHYPFLAEAHSPVDPIRLDPFNHPSFFALSLVFFFAFVCENFVYTFVHFIAFHFISFSKWPIFFFWFSLNGIFFIFIFCALRIIPNSSTCFSSFYLNLTFNWKQMCGGGVWNENVPFVCVRITV